VLSIFLIALSNLSWLCSLTKFISRFIYSSDMVDLLLLLVEIPLPFIVVVLPCESVLVISPSDILI